MKYRQLLCMMVFFAVLSSGCISDNPFDSHSNRTEFANDVNKSQIYYDNLVISDPSNATAWVMRGNYYNNIFNQYENALQSYDRALELDPDYGYGWYSKGVTLNNMRRFEEAKVCFSNAIKYDPSLASVIPHGNGIYAISLTK